MLFQSKRRSTHRQKKYNYLNPSTLGIVLIVIALWLVLFYDQEQQGSARSPLTRILHFPVSLIQSSRTMAVHTFNEVVDNFRSKKELVKLREELEKLRSENLELRYKLQRHDAYREATNLPRIDSMPSVVATVLMRDIRMVDYLIIDRGKKDGLDVNMPVLSANLVLGRTIKVTNSAARVQPLSDPRIAIPVYVDGTPYHGILRGSEEGENLLLTDLYLSDTTADEFQTPQPGDVVYTSGIGNVFPADLKAGIVSDATSDLGKVVEPAVDIRSVKAVLVLTDQTLKTEIDQLLSSN